MPSLFRFLTLLGVLGGLAYGAMPRRRSATVAWTIWNKTNL